MSDKPTLSFGNTIMFASPRINLGEPQEIKVTYEWQPNPIFYVGLKVRIEGVLCEVCSVGKDGAVSFQRIEEVGE
jgi:hypothetical protein